MNIGLVLSGGGAKGIAHIGSIKALEEYNIIPTHIAGTSSGAVVGALYASGASFNEILNFFKTTSLFSTTKFAYKKPGFINTDKFYNDLRICFSEDNFSALKKKLFVTATDIIQGRLEIFSEGELIKAILASASFPGVFTPVEMNNTFYVDGGTLNNFPVEPLKNICDALIGIYVHPLEVIKPSDLKNSISVANRAFEISTSAVSMNKFTQFDLVISPVALIKYGTFRVKDLDDIFKIGYTYTKKLLEDNPKLVERLSA